MTPQLSVGGELFWLRSAQKSGAGFAARHAGASHVATAQVATTGLLSLAYIHRVSDKVSLAADFLWNWTGREAGASFGEFLKKKKKKKKKNFVFKFFFFQVFFFQIPEFRNGGKEKLTLFPLSLSSSKTENNNKTKRKRLRLRPPAVPPARPRRHRRPRRRAARGEAQRRGQPRALRRAGPPAQGREVRDRDDGRGVGVGAVEGEEGKLARGGGGWRRRDERGRGTREREVFFVFSLSFLEDPTDNPLVKKSVSSFLFLL